MVQLGWFSFCLVILSICSPTTQTTFNVTKYGAVGDGKSDDTEELTNMVIVLLCVFMLNFSLTIQTTFDVTRFGAVGDGKTDDTQAFVKTWTAVCGDKGAKPTMVVPAGKKFLLQMVNFVGPCSSLVTFKVLGKIVAPKKNNFVVPTGRWISFRYINGLVINGNGSIHGSATFNDWWKAPIPPDRPIMLILATCTNATIQGLSFLRSPRVHIVLLNSRDVVISNIKINTPGNSQNTDGINMARSSNVRILDSNIRCGDDCISMIGGNSDIHVENINCGPGHGISVGSLGGTAGAVDIVENVHVKHCTFRNTLTAARIKTASAGSGFARNITYEDIRLVDSYNPIIIDQNYCIGNPNNCYTKASRVKVSDVSFIGFKGTSMMETAVNLDCSALAPCQNIRVNNINITASTSLKQKVIASCHNAHGTTSGSNVPNVNCLHR